MSGVIASARRLLVLAASGALLAGCTSGSGPGGSSTPSTSRTPLVAPSSRPATGPVPAGRTTVVAASACPFAPQDFVADTVGMRLGRVTVQRLGGRAIGCRIYALQGTALARSEHLPGPNQPAVDVTTTRYPSAVAAHNAFARTADKGANPQQDGLGHGVTAVCFQTAFDPHDHGTDWACAFSTGRTAVLVRTVVTSPALDALLVAKKVLGAL